MIKVAVITQHGLCMQVASGYRRPLPELWPEGLKMLVGDCWAQEPMLRPSMAAVYARMEELQRSGMSAQLDGGSKISQVCRCNVM